MKLNNNQICNYYLQLQKAFNDNDQKLPVKINFYLQKNKNTLLLLAQDIEEARIKIAKANGVFDEENNMYQILNENLEFVKKEIEDLMSLEQEVNIYKININDLNNDIILTTAQMEAMLFMIEE